MCVICHDRLAIFKSTALASSIGFKEESHLALFLLDSELGSGAFLFSFSNMLSPVVTQVPLNFTEAFKSLTRLDVGASEA